MPARVNHKAPDLFVAPEPYKLREFKKRIAIVDTETDPFAEGRIVAPFAIGFYLPDTKEYYQFWGDDCVTQYFDFLAVNFAHEELCIYAHNGGNFDFYFFLSGLDPNSAPFIINGRLVKIMIHGQEYRDSYAILPVPLKAYDKKEIDYAKFERYCRETYKAEILDYLESDCVFLSDLVCEFIAMFGDKLTIASVALSQLNSYHGFERLSLDNDLRLRPYYFGGRCECFETGLLAANDNVDDKWIIVDVNSMYPDAMARFKHPISNKPVFGDTIGPDTFFAHIDAYSAGALPVRGLDNSLSFPNGRGTFYATIHEIKAGIATNKLKILKVLETIDFLKASTFDDFVNKFYELRQTARRNKDEIRLLLYKLVLNSSYGKFAQDPRDYEDYLFDPDETPSPSEGWVLSDIILGKCLYAKPKDVLTGRSFFNVATAASITGASRSQLFRGICAADRPIYCDTDSLICKALEPNHGIVIDDKELGAWKLEAVGKLAAIGGKKMYAVFNTLDNLHMDDPYKWVETLPGEGIYTVKQASKGVKLTGEQIKRVAAGDVIEYANPVPKFKLDGTAQFVTRKVKRT